MTSQFILTAQDCFDYAIAYERGHSISADRAILATVLHSAYMEVGQEFDWSFLWKQGRVNLRAAITAGTVGYDHTGGAEERLAVFSQPVLTEDMTRWSIRLGGVPCRIERVLNSTMCTLEVAMNPGKDIGPGASYVLYPAYYPLPNDFKKLTQPYFELDGRPLIERSYDEMVALENEHKAPGSPLYYCIRGAEDLYGSLGLWLVPAPSDSWSIGYVYERWPREVKYTGHGPQERVGTVSVNGRTVTGTGTSFEPDMVGAIIRFSQTNTAPTGWRGAYPFTEQRSIMGVTSKTQLVLDRDVSHPLTGVGYTISDPIDIDASLHQALLDCMVFRLALMQEWKDTPSMGAIYQTTLHKAKSVNSYGGRRVMGGMPMARRLRDCAVYTGDIG